MSLEALYSRFATFAKENSKIVLIIKNAFLGIILAYPVYFLYSKYTLSKERKAEQFFSESFSEYNKAIQADLKGVGGKSIEIAWDDVHSLFKLGQEKNRSADLASYMGIFNAQCLARQGKLNEAKNVLKDSLNKLGYSPYREIYRVFESLLMIDAGDINNGYNQLKHLAYDLGNQNRDMALYFLGCYEQIIGNRDNAINAFNNISTISNIQSFPSPWQSLADNQLSELE